MKAPKTFRRAIRLSELHSHPHQPPARTDGVGGLAKSILSNGQLNSITVVERRTCGKGYWAPSGYYVIDGHRRKAAAELAGLDSLRAEVHANVSDKEMNEWINVVNAVTKTYGARDALQSFVRSGATIKVLSGAHRESYKAAVRVFGKRRAHTMLDTADANYGRAAQASEKVIGTLKKTAEWYGIELANVPEMDDLALWMIKHGCQRKVRELANSLVGGGVRSASGANKRIKALFRMVNSDSAFDETRVR